MAMFAWISAPENVPRTTLHSDEIPTEANGWAGQNDTGFRNAEMDGLLDELERELDRDRRKTMWQRLQQIYAEELPALPLYFRSDAAHLAALAGGRGADRPHGHQHALGRALAGGDELRPARPVRCCAIWSTACSRRRSSCC